MRIDKELRVYGYNDGAEPFREIVVDLHHALYPSWNDEELQRHPREALQYCDAVRVRTNCPDLPDEFILRVRSNLRKLGAGCR